MGPAKTSPVASLRVFWACHAASRSAALAARAVGRSVKYQRSISGPMRARIGARSLSAITPNTAWVVG